MAFLNKTGVERLWAHIISRLGEKVDIVEGKGLSSNDYTDEEKEKLENLEALVGELQTKVAELESILDSNNYLITSDK